MLLDARQRRLVAEEDPDLLQAGDDAVEGLDRLDADVDAFGPLLGADQDDDRFSGFEEVALFAEAFGEEHGLI